MKGLIISFLFITFAVKIFSQPFSLDTSFKAECPSLSAYFPNNQVVGIIQEATGNLLIYGHFWNFGLTYANSLRTDYYGNKMPDWNFLIDNSTYIEKIKSKDGIYYAREDLPDAIVKLDSNGKADTSWYNNTKRCFTWMNASGVPYHIFSDHSMLLGGTYRLNPYPGPYTWRSLIRLKPNGLMDSSFTHNPSSHVHTILKYNNHQFLLGGYFLHYDSIPITGLCRIDTAGNLDTTFHSIFTIGGNLPTLVQDDGKIIVTGTFKIQNCPDTLLMVRINPDGSLDSTFNNFNNVPYIYTNGRRNVIYTVCKTTDGGYLIGGRIDIYQGYSRKNILKTDINGFIDTNYFADGGIDSAIHAYDLTVYNIEPAPGGQYYVMGCFRTYYDQLVPPIIRINSITNGVHNPAKPNEYFLLFPNPATTEATIRFSMLTSGSKLRVYNTLGQIITEEEIPQGCNEYKLNVSRYKSGLYKIILLEKNEVRGQQSMVIHR